MGVSISTIDIDIDNSTTIKTFNGQYVREEQRDKKEHQCTGSVSADKENGIHHEGRLSSLSVTRRVR